MAKSHKSIHPFNLVAFNMLQEVLGSSEKLRSGDFTARLVPEGLALGFQVDILVVQLSLVSYLVFWGLPKLGVSQNGLFRKENQSKLMIWG